jgi:hypothetical protein
MRGKFFIILGAAAAGLGIFVSMLFSHPQAATKGTTTFTLTTLSYGGKYSPKNAGVAWVADAQDQFVKTLKLWADKRKQHLIKWNASSNGNVVDAVTGATARAPQTHTATWDGTDVNGAVVNDGTYKIYVEFTEDNSASGSTPGKWVTVSFTKGATSQTLAPADQAYFKAMKLDYAPDAGAPLPAALSGNVTDAKTASALANVTVQLQSNGQTRYTATSSASGQYQFAAVDAGAYALAASKSGYQNYSAAITLTDGQQLSNKNIALTPIVNGASLSGTIFEAGTNQLLAGATVQLKNGNQVMLETATNPNGAYAFANVAPGSYTLAALKNGYDPASQIITLAPGQTVTNRNLTLAKTVASDTTPPPAPRNLSYEVIR